MLQPGQVFATRYRVLQMLASGGMGAVFEAEHVGTEQRVALKVLWPQILALASAREKFELEAKIAARVKSEHIVHVLDAGFDEATRSPYLVMELLVGETLTARVDRAGPIPLGEALTVLRQVARGLDAAHGFRDATGAPTPIIHRDLKPDNLFLSARHDRSPLVKILDFGIAKVLSESRNISHEVRGTPTYMAFEQVLAGTLSPQTDLWALGLITYFLLTGRQYWRTADDPNAGVQALFAEIMTLPLEAPSVRSQQQSVRVRLPAAFDGWLLKCIDRMPERRFASAGEAVETLERDVQRSIQQAAPSLAYAVTERAEHPHLDARHPIVTRGAATMPSPTAASFPALESEEFKPIVRARSTVRATWYALGGAALLGIAATSFWLLRARTQPMDTEPALAPASLSTPAEPSASPSAIPRSALETTDIPDRRPVARVQTVPVPPVPDLPPTIEPASVNPEAKSSPREAEAPPAAKPKPKPAHAQVKPSGSIRAVNKSADSKPRAAAANSAAPATPDTSAPAKPQNPFELR